MEIICKLDQKMIALTRKSNISDFSAYNFWINRIPPTLKTLKKGEIIARAFASPWSQNRLAIVGKAEPRLRGCRVIAISEMRSATMR
jgi:hypothetical protein